MLTLRDVRIVGDSTTNQTEVRIPLSESRPESNNATLDLPGCFVFPGLTNAHDHLELNLFPILEKEGFNNYIQWAEAVQNNHAAEIERQVAFPFKSRWDWGILKNLISGVTTVMHHGPRYLSHKDNLIDVIHTRHFHSLNFEKRWYLKLLDPRLKEVVLHLGEGVDAIADQELARVMRYNLFRKPLVGIHGMGVSPEQSRHLAALIWCPDSNIRLYGSTARVDHHHHHTDILFGTDATLTSTWNIWDHIRLARSLQYMSDDDLYATVTSEIPHNFHATEASRLGRKSSDYVIVRPSDRDQEEWDQFYNLDPGDIVMVIKKGQIIYYDQDIDINDLDQGYLRQQYWNIEVEGRSKLIGFDAPALIREVNKYGLNANLPVSSKDL